MLWLSYCVLFLQSYSFYWCIGQSPKKVPNNDRFLSQLFMFDISKNPIPVLVLPFLTTAIDENSTQVLEIAID